MDTRRKENQAKLCGTTTTVNAMGIEMLRHQMAGAFAVQISSTLNPQSPTFVGEKGVINHLKGGRCRSGSYCRFGVMPTSGDALLLFSV